MGQQLEDSSRESQGTLHLVRHSTAENFPVDVYLFIYVCLSACVSVIFRVCALIVLPKRGVAGLVPRSRAYTRSALQIENGD